VASGFPIQSGTGQELAHTTTLSQAVFGLLRPGAAEPAGGFDDPVVIGAAPWAAPKVDRGAWIDARGVLPGQLELDVGVEDFLTGGAARVSCLGAQEVIEATNSRRPTTSARSARCA
jgi:hypothetical protein